MGLFDLIFGFRNKKIKKYIAQGATILDVRTQREFDQGNISNAVHIPLQDLHNRYTELDKTASYIVVCQSGVRSSKAAKFLSLNNYDAINGGGWQSLNRLIG